MDVDAAVEMSRSRSSCGVVLVYCAGREGAGEMLVSESFYSSGRGGLVLVSAGFIASICFNWEGL
jgi:hypothetical protein